MTTNKRPADSRIQSLPSDLSRLLGERGLLNLVLDAVQTVDPASLQTENPPRPAYRPQMLLTLLTYCYAAKIYGSRDIEWATRYDKTVRYICAHIFPDWQTLRRFRRQHRGYLEQTLVYVFKQAWAGLFDWGEADDVGCDWFESDLRAEVGRIVRDRLDVAALMDGVESE
jgi:transposase